MSNRIFKINLFKSKLSNIPIKPKKNIPIKLQSSFI